MKNQLILIVLLLSFHYAEGQIPVGSVVLHTLQSTALKNEGQEKTSCRISIYLPPGYAQSTNRYPVIYYLHGFTGTDSIYPGMKQILDVAIYERKIKPFILVIPDQNTQFQGSFYTNSSLNGKWEDFTAFDLIKFMDENFRTLATRESRGLAGHSMGGYGAFKIGMLHPDVFSSIYALSPGLLAFVKEFGPNSTSFKELQNITSKSELNKTYYPRVLIAVARAWSPNLSKPPFYCDLPFTYIGDSLVVHQDVLTKWEQQMPVYMVDKFASHLRQLKAIKLDWGRNDAPRFPVQIGMLSQRLENLGIAHFAEEYIGDHGNKIWSKDGRVFTDLLPFFNDYLKF